MSTGTIVGIVVAVVLVLAVVVLVVYLQGRRRRLQERFGPEYDRTLENQPNRRTAERELSEREKRHDELELRPLSASARDNYGRNWVLIQERFVDSPNQAVTDADALVIALMTDRGYPTEGYEDRLSLLSVEHGKTLGNYRAAHDISLRNQRNAASTEDLRQAMVHYRALFADLLAAGADADADADARPADRGPAGAHRDEGRTRNA